MFPGDSRNFSEVFFTTFLNISRRVGHLKVTKMVIMIVLLKVTVNSWLLATEIDIIDTGMVLHWG